MAKGSNSLVTWALTALIHKQSWTSTAQVSQFQPHYKNTEMIMELNSKWLISSHCTATQDLRLPHLQTPRLHPDYTFIDPERLLLHADVKTDKSPEK